MAIIQWSDYMDTFRALLCLRGTPGEHYITYATYLELERRSGKELPFRHRN